MNEYEMMDMQGKSLIYLYIDNMAGCERIMKFERKSNQANETQ